MEILAKCWGILKIDPAYGSMHDYLLLIKELHRRGMKFYMDMETQYDTEDHTWWKDGVNNLKSPYSDCILYDDKAHTTSSAIIYNLKGLLGYDSVYRKITTMNLYSPKVLEYNYRLFRFWEDPMVFRLKNNKAILTHYGIFIAKS